MATVYRTAGVDVSKPHLDLAFAGHKPRQTKRFDNNPAGFHQLVQACQSQGVDLVAVESTGGYERALVAALHQAQIPVAVVQPSLIRHHARAKRVLAKNDAIDATMIADYAQQHRPRQTPVQDENRRKIRAFNDRRDQLVQDLVRESNRLEACDCDLIVEQLQKSIARLEQEIATLEQEIDELIRTDATLAAQYDTLQTVKGIGEVCATVLTIHLPELGRVNRQQIAALAGLAPYDHDSGNRRGKRRLYGGRARVRTALYMSTLAATRFNPIIRQTYQRLLANGKTKKVALCACARKLLVHLNAMIAQTHSTNLPGGKPAGA